MYSVLENVSNDFREGHIIIGDETFTVTQDGKIEETVFSELMVTPTIAKRFSLVNAVVTARDQNNQPMSEVKVDASGSSGAIIFPKSKATGTDGKAKFLFMFLSANGGKITFTAGGFTETITQE